MTFYYVEELGFLNVDEKYLPTRVGDIKKNPLMELYIMRVFSEPPVWVQRNYKSGKCRFIIQTKALELADETIEFLPTSDEYKNACVVLSRAQKILSLKSKLEKIKNEINQLGVVTPEDLALLVKPAGSLTSSSESSATL